MYDRCFQICFFTYIISVFKTLEILAHNFELLYIISKLTSRTYMDYVAETAVHSALHACQHLQMGGGQPDRQTHPTGKSPPVSTSLTFHNCTLFICCVLHYCAEEGKCNYVIFSFFPPPPLLITVCFVYVSFLLFFSHVHSTERVMGK